jgi:16S rRNA (uracil1498-N3)-methyltransferase
MTRRRFFVPSNAIHEGIAHLPDDQSHHLRDVLRIGAGEVVEVFDGRGNGYTGKVEFCDARATIRCLEPLPPQGSPAPLVLAAALIKPAKFEWMLQKATELGVHEIVPMQTRRCDIRIPQNKMEQRLQRWSRIVQEASKQCGRNSFPRVHGLLDCTDILQGREFDGFSKFVFHERASGLWRPAMLGSPLGSVLICIGPEGGWEDAEIEMAADVGARVSSLGPWTLRAETAAVAAVSIVQYHIRLQSSEAGNF